MFRSLRFAIASALVVAGCADPPAERPPEPVAPVEASASVEAPAEPPVVDAPMIPETALTKVTPIGPVRSGALVLGSIDDTPHALIADTDDRALTIVNLETKKECFRLGLPGEPAHVLVAAPGRIFVTVASASRVVEAALVEGELVVRNTVDVPAEPAGMAVTADGDLLVASRWDAALSSIDTRTMKVTRRVDLPRDPYGVALLQNGEEAVVTHVTGGHLSVVNWREGTVRNLDASRVDHKTSSGGMLAFDFPMSSKQERRFPLTQSIRTRRRAGQAFALTVGDGGEILVSAALADGSRAPTGGGYGGGGNNIRTQAGVELTVAADGRAVDVPSGTARDVGNDCILPRASAFDAKEGLLLVACVGDNRVLAVESRKRPAGMVRHRFSVPKGPTGLALDPRSRTWVAWSQFAGAVSVGKLAKRGMRAHKPEVIALERKTPLPAAVARGRELFHLAGRKRTIASDGRACASCHPSGRDDGVTWSTPEGPRQTPILMGRLDGTAPFGWNGRMEDVHTHLRRTLDRLGGMGISQSQREDLVAYINHMQPPVAKASDAELVERGRELFTDGKRCSSCHPLGSHTTDGYAHDLGNAAKADLVRTFNTPTLRFVAQSAPYYHDGRYPTLDALLADPQTGMGTHADLEADERTALVAFLQTL